MKKMLALIMIAIVTMTTLTGCGEKKNNDTPQVQGDVQGIENVNTDALTPSITSFK